MIHTLKNHKCIINYTVKGGKIVEKAGHFKYNEGTLKVQ